MTIDWSKAPADATHYLPAYNSTVEPLWLHLRGDKVRMVGHMDTSLWSYVYADDEQPNLDLRRAIPRPAPEPAAWSGDGLPPVGTVCEYSIGRSGTWHPCEIRYELAGYPSELVGEWAVVVWCPDISRDQVAASRTEQWEFRPIRSAEQIAGDERKAAIAEMIKDLKKVDGCGFTSHAEDLYAMGYRKTAKSPD